MRSAVLLGGVAALAARAVANESITTEMFIVGFSSVQMVASVIASDKTATTFSVACATSSGCELPTDFTFTQGPSTVHFDYTHTPTASTDPAGTVTVGCTITNSDHGLCSKTISAKLGTITSTSTAVTTTFTNGGSDLGGQIVTVTAGSLSISSASSSTSKASSAGTTTTVKSTATVVPEQSATGATTATASSTDTAFFAATKSVDVSSSTSKAGSMPMITAPARLIMGGAAAALALAAF